MAINQRFFNDIEEDLVDTWEIEPNGNAPMRNDEDDEDDTPLLRQSNRSRNNVDRFTQSQAHGYLNVKKYCSLMVTYLCALTSQKPEYNYSYLTALAMDPTFGVMDLCSASSLNFMIKTAFMYKANTSKDPDTPNIREALTGAHREEFIHAMMDEINELQNHGTWEVME